MSPRSGLTTERVVRAAAELADDIGFDKLTLSAVARKFGVSRTTASRWHRTLDRHGMERLHKRKAPGRPSRLTAA